MPVPIGHGPAVAGAVGGPGNLAESAKPTAPKRNGEPGESELRDESAGEDGRVQSGHESYLV